MLRLSSAIAGLVLTAALLFSGAVGVQSIAALEASTPTPQSEPADNPEVIALRAQLDEMRRSEDRLFQTVFWALGTVALIGIGFLTFNIVQSRHLYERDKQAMASEVRQELQAQIDQFRSESKTQADERSRALSEQFHAFTIETQDQTKSWLERSSEQFDVFIKNVNARISEQTRALTRQLEEESQQLSQQVKTVKNEAEGYALMLFNQISTRPEGEDEVSSSRSVKVGTEYYSTRYDFWSLRHDLSLNSVLSYSKAQSAAEMFIIAAEVGDPTKLSDALQKLHWALHDEILDEQTTARVTQLLESLPENYGILRNWIVNQLQYDRALDLDSIDD